MQAVASLDSHLGSVPVPRLQLTHMQVRECVIFLHYKENYNLSSLGKFKTEIIIQSSTQSV